MIEIKNLTKIYDNVAPFKNLNLTINNGDVISIIGPSGTGKSTLLRCLNLLETPTSGQIIIDGVDITDKKTDVSKIRRNIGMVFQTFNLFPHLTVIENIMKPQMDILKRSKQEAYDKAVELLKSVGLLEKKLNYPDELSGGQKQRIAIARTLSMDCDYILFDEPTSALDPTMVGEVQAVIKKVAATGKTLLIVTHEMKFAKDVANRVIFLSDGGICEDGTPAQIFDNPQNIKTKRFIQRIKFVEFTIKSTTDDILSTITKLDEFLSSVGLSNKFKNKIKSCYEELALNTLFPHIDDLKEIKVSFEYNEEHGFIKFDTLYKGNKYNPLESKDDLPIIILSHNASTCEYKNQGQNSISVIIKESVN